MPTHGFAILPRADGVSDDVLRQYQDFAVANISDVMSRTTGTTALRPYHRTRRILGRAFTVRTRPGDNLMVHKALDSAQPGDVIVVDAGGDTRNAIIGEIMTGWGARRGLAGIIIDGAIRDTEVIGAADFPVYARAAAHRGPYKDGPGEINVPVSIDGMVVLPGDLIVGDADGLLAIRADEAAAIAEKVRAIAASEASILAQIAAGTLDRSWVDASLKAKGAL
ncbi:RraA family protein [Bordetella genomosp. 1]|uniref:Putative 4-hydroxy-4-methyl-2-oxoglutarate aldolase n=1 Tax=Bordetella genomosp. 1 TaxID=1395607 RepID=A0ABX4EYZ6_9BORD|nr:RraA family protein [Bordetella genomosp. 1]MDQ8031129.1 RraA family protein [Bordetella sp.]OZI64971.1 methyltransferase [Bordetella genomosp. 1]